MPKYWVKIISHMGDSPKWVKSRRRREKERLNDGNNNGQATQARMAHASRLGQNCLQINIDYTLYR